MLKNNKQNNLNYLEDLGGSFSMIFNNYHIRYAFYDSDKPHAPGPTKEAGKYFRP